MVLSSPHEQRGELGIPMRAVIAVPPIRSGVSHRHFTTENVDNQIQKIATWRRVQMRAAPLWRTQQNPGLSNARAHEPSACVASANWGDKGLSDSRVPALHSLGLQTPVHSHTG